MDKKNQKGFTLVELSIVLVIIGLIVGGVLVGQDLIQAARIRSTVAQIEKFDTGAAAFLAKFNALPGDILNTQADAFNLASGKAMGNNVGDANGLIDNQATPALNEWDSANAEAEEYFCHLSDQAMIQGTTCGVKIGSQLGKGFWSIGMINGISDTNGDVGAGSLRHYALTAGSGSAAGDDTTDGILTPAEAFGIDAKLDDGQWNTGVVIGIDGGDFDLDPAGTTDSNMGTAAGGAALCNVDATNYNVSVENNLCSLLVRSQT